MSSRIAVILIPENSVGKFENIISELEITQLAFRYINSKNELINFAQSPNQFDYVISFGTSIIVPEEILLLPGLIAVNIHAASPSFPGRDPHHFAIYENAKEYGATLHYMNKLVDAGPIIDVNLFSVTKEDSFKSLLAKANDSGWKLMKRLLTWIKNGESFPASQYQWGTQKRTRKDFLEYCKITSDISTEELERRIRAFHVDGFTNLSIDIHGRQFFYKK